MPSAGRFDELARTKSVCFIFFFCLFVLFVFEYFSIIIIIIVISLLGFTLQKISRQF